MPPVILGFFHSYAPWLFQISRKTFLVFSVLTNTLQLLLEHVDLPFVALVLLFQIPIVFVGQDGLDFDFNHLAFVLLDDYTPFLMALQLLLGLTTAQLGLLESVLQFQN